jgi:hypothetical protein
MNEANIRLEVQHVIRALGFWDYHPPDDNYDERINKIISTFHLDKWKNAFFMIKNILFPRGQAVAPGRPDIYGLNPRGLTCVIEVKTIEPKVNIEPWFNPAMISDKQRNWLDAWCIEAMGSAFLAIGTLEQPRSLWIIPWEWWVNLENRLQKQNAEMKVTLSMLPEEFRLSKISGGWELPLYHPLLGMATPSSSPNKLQWKKAYSLRFETKKEKV